MRRGELRLFGQVNSVLLGGPFTVSEEESSDSSPSLWIPRVQFGGAFYGAPSDLLELGVHARYASGSTAKPSIEDANDYWEGEGRHSAWSFGTGVRFNRWFGERGTGFVSFSADLDIGVIHYSMGEDSDFSILLRPGISLQSGYAVNRYLTLFGVIALEAHERNQSEEVFTYGEGSEPSPTTTYPMIVDGVGAEIRVSLWFADIVVFYPLEFEDDLDFGPGLVVLTGVAL